MGYQKNRKNALTSKIPEILKNIKSEKSEKLTYPGKIPEIYKKMKDRQNWKNDAKSEKLTYRGSRVPFH